MQRCFQLALNGAGKVAPNPMVGAVLVYNNIIIGEGYHEQYGNAHAEVNCINSVLPENHLLIEKSTLYVSLEPCAHFGKTPPCADLIIKMKIPTVVIGCRDSYEEVNGKGIDKLIGAGITVISGVLEKEAIELNKRFFTYHRQSRPYIILKWAQSEDHKIAKADRSRVFITNEISNRLVHKWRSEEAGIMIGTATALHDDPSLTTRLWPGRSPVRIVIDGSLKIPATHQLLSGKEPTIVFNYVSQAEKDALTYIKIEKGQTAIPAMLSKLHELNIQSILVEGGARLLQSFIDEKLWDEARVITNGQLIIGEGVDAPILKQHSFTCSAQSGSDNIQYYKPLSTIQ